MSKLRKKKRIKQKHKSNRNVSSQMEREGFGTTYASLSRLLNESRTHIGVSRVDVHSKDFVASPLVFSILVFNLGIEIFLLFFHLLVMERMVDVLKEGSVSLKVTGTAAFVMYAIFHLCLMSATARRRASWSSSLSIRRPSRRAMTNRSETSSPTLSMRTDCT